MTLLIIGIGQSLRGDDSAGLAAVSHWLNTYPARAEQSTLRVVLAEVTGLGLLDELLGVETAILVDAVRSGVKKPGSLHLLREEDLATFSPGSTSAHGLGVAETLSLGRQIYPEEMPAKIILIGIEVGEIGLGKRLSPEVSASLPSAAQMIEEQLSLL